MMISDLNLNIFNSQLMRLAFYQQDIAWEDPQENFRKVELAFEDVAADILIVPETFSTGFSDNMVAMAEAPKGATYDFALRMARKHDALFVGTWTVKVDGVVYNRLHWVRPDGEFGFYDKAHTFRMSSEASQLGRGCSREVFEWRGWRIKPAVCYDLRFPKWLRNAPRDCETMEYDLMLVCANWPGSRHEAWSTLLKARAIENLSYVVGVNRVGTDGTGIPYTGNSAAIDFKGIEIAGCADKETVATVELNAEALQRFRQHWPFYLDFD